MNMADLNISTKQKAIGLIIILTLILGGTTFMWSIDRYHTTIYKDGDAIARAEWDVFMHRTWSTIKYSYQENNCERDGGEVRTYENSPKRCYYPENFYKELNRKLKSSKLDYDDRPDTLVVSKGIDYFKYGTSGEVAGDIWEDFYFPKHTEDIKQMPEKYVVEWKSHDKSLYYLVWTIDKLREINLPDGTYHDCSYNFGEIKIDLLNDCSKLDRAVINNAENEIKLYFKPSNEDQELQVKLIDPPSVESVNISSSYEFNTTLENISISYNINDSSNYVPVITWLRNSTNTSQVMMPFEGLDNDTYTMNYGTGNCPFTNATYNATGGHDGNGSYSFIGTLGEYIIVNESFDFNNNSYTMMGWFNSNNSDSCFDAGTGKACAVMLIGNATTYHAIVTVDNAGEPVIYGVLSDIAPAVIGGTPVSLNEWYHVALRYNGTAYQLFLNGTTNGNPDADVSTDPENSLEVGAGFGVYWWNGSLDDMRVYNYSMSDEQINAIFNGEDDKIVSQDTKLSELWQGCVVVINDSGAGNKVCSGTLNVTNGTTYTISSDVSNIIVEMPIGVAINDSVLFTIEFGSNREANLSAIPTPIVDTTTIIDRDRKNGTLITIVDRFNNNLFAKMAKRILGLNKLPLFNDDKWYIPILFEGNGTAIAIGDVFNMTINFTEELEDRNINSSYYTLDNNSVRVYANTIFGGCLYKVNDECTHIPFMIE